MKITVSLKENREFLLLYRKGKFYAGKYLVLYVLPSGLNTHRLGVTVSKKVGKSVKRNELKRYVKENFRHYEKSLKQWFDFVFVLRRNEVSPGFFDIKKEMKFLLKKLDLLELEILP